jgi:hypothetical protein
MSQSNLAARHRRAKLAGAAALLAVAGGAYYVIT